MERSVKMKFSAAMTAVLLCSGSLAAQEAPCGGGFAEWKVGLVDEAVELGFSRRTASTFFGSASHDPDVIRRDRAQGIFKSTFIDFSKKVIQEYRINYGAKFYKEHRRKFDRVEERFGVPAGVLLSFLALETDFGQVQGDFNTLNSLMTLAHDCRRPELFRPHLFAALQLYLNGDFDPAATTGAWAGEIGMIQMLPSDILKYGIDGDGDGRVRLKDSVSDALLTGAKVLVELGWSGGDPWLVEVKVPRHLDWSLTGLNSELTVANWHNLGIRTRSGRSLERSLHASLLLPQGRFGPAFLAFPNYRIYFEWNRSFVYATTSAFFATMFSGEPMYLENSPEPGLDDQQMEELQAKLLARGHDIGPVDGILGALTRGAVQEEQFRLGLPADAWPTPDLLNRL